MEGEAGRSAGHLCGPERLAELLLGAAVAAGGLEVVDAVLVGLLDRSVKVRLAFLGDGVAEVPGRVVAPLHLDAHPVRHASKQREPSSR